MEIVGKSNQFLHCNTCSRKAEKLIQDLLEEDNMLIESVEPAGPPTSEAAIFGPMADKLSGAF
jgi:hypothetical protein